MSFQCTIGSQSHSHVEIRTLQIRRPLDPSSSLPASPARNFLHWDLSANRSPITTAFSRKPPHLPVGLPTGSENAYRSRQFSVHQGPAGSYLRNPSVLYDGRNREIGRKKMIRQRCRINPTLRWATAVLTAVFLLWLPAASHAQDASKEYGIA